MNKKILAFIFFAFLGCSEEQLPEQPDKLPSNAIQIGDQIWMKKNLDIGTFRNGDEIFHSKNQSDWEYAYINKLPAWSYYDDLEENGEVYGKIYNYYAITDPRGLAPQGWRIPKIEDWDKLFEFNGGIDNAGIKLKSTSYWLGENGTNESGFNALPGGERFLSGYFDSKGIIASFWTSSFDSNDDIILVVISDIYENSNIHISKSSEKTFYPSLYLPGIYLRCIKEK
ncbi:fibrobacter succinogenes major paralogous domain-containing protein [Cyclobacterium sp. 1_MG-2023]|uniref:fibrobacter succinogenes major paralogous domain-containing protein n=1 Tax=Cyclobacterium sp. 1_MG-2023 TaxID=3062681 RepID=UPI0026E25445|nr:fibrobacter succinogenes major paralogous domain-containing protein [Cyclobacterium sp. 1_MG-2023]MDO6437127.1 fibrobacter succinogenes major paralogous domain-containing protein [Cyclobacterium sp. 1_MG-2023]